MNLIQQLEKEEIERLGKTSCRLALKEVLRARVASRLKQPWMRMLS